MPNAIREYLACFNAALEVGVRSRRLIFLEVSDHLRERVGRELREGASDTEAARRAITAFGPPEEVARSFQAGLLGALDRQLALRTRRLHRWMATHRWGAVATKLALLTLLYAAVASIGELAGARYSLSGPLSIFTLGAMWVLWWGPQAPLRGRILARFRASPRKRPEYRVDTNFYLTIFSFPMVSTWLSMVTNAYDPFWLLPLLVPGFAVFQLGAAWVTERVLDLVVCRGAPTANRASWKAEHPWRSAFFEIWSAPLALLALVLAYPAPVALRGTFAVVVTAVTLLVALGLCLVRSQREKTSYARSLEEPA